MLTRGRVLQGRYRIERPLGQGGAGAVFLATDEKSNRAVAIKVVRVESESATRQLSLEGRILRGLSHPNLPRVYGVFEDENQSFLVMDFIPGRALNEVLRAEGRLDEVRVLDWACQLCDVLDYLHRQNPPVIFRDLKPSNIMLVNNRLKLIDFGIAKVREPGAPAVTHTVARGMVTRGFSAPEQYGGGTDAASDIYSLGATLYCLLTKELPPESLDLATGHVTLTDIRTLRPDVSERTARAVSRLMEVDRKRRPRSIAEVRQLFGFEDDAARPDAHEVATSRGPVGFASGHPGVARDKRRVPPAPRSRTSTLRMAMAAAAVLLSVFVGIAAWRKPWAGAASPPSTHVSVSSQPAGAEVFIDKVRLGTAPMVSRAISPGRHQVHVAVKGFVPSDQAIEVREGETLALEVTLTPLPTPLPTRLPTPVAAPATPHAAPPAVTAAPPSATPRVRLAAPTPIVRRKVATASPSSHPRHVAAAAPPPIVDVPPPSYPSEASVDRNSVSPLSGEPGAVTQRGNGVLILPGRRIGKLALGVPVATYTRGVNRSFKTEYRGQDALQFRDELIVIVDKGYVARIVVLQSARVYFHTASGVAIGSAAGQVEEAYGHAQRIGNNGKQTDWLYPARGVRFTLTDGYVSEIEVFLPTLAR